MQRVPALMVGEFGTRRTVEIMKRIVADSLTDAAVMSAAVDVVRYTPERDLPEQARALYYWLKSNVSFLPDPNVPGEVLRTPRFLLSEIKRHGIARGDCDDVAMLSAALAKSIGLSAEFIVAAYDAAQPFAHVFTRVWVGDGWFPLDVTEKVTRTPQRAIVERV
jgi:transglutaminase-like putative cysteine protease